MFGFLADKAKNLKETISLDLISVILEKVKVQGLIKSLLKLPKTAFLSN